MAMWLFLLASLLVFAAGARVRKPAYPLLEAWSEWETSPSPSNWPIAGSLTLCFRTHRLSRHRRSLPNTAWATRWKSHASQSSRFGKRLRRGSSPWKSLRSGFCDGPRRRKYLACWKRDPGRGRTCSNAQRWLFPRRTGPPIRMLQAAGSWNTRGGSIWNTRRICPISWPTKLRSATGAPRDRRIGATYDTVESEITFRGRRAVRQQIRRNGKPWDQPFDALPGFKWYEGFETEISPLFDPQCPTTIEYQGRSKAGGRQLLEYRFSSPVDGCFPFLYFAYQRYNPARTGHVFIEDPGGSVIQVDDEAGGFPADFEFAGREEHMFWDYVKIGESSHLLPVRANFLVGYSDGTRYRVEVEYKNHRHFEASTNDHVQLRSAGLLLGNKLLDHEYKMLLRGRSSRGQRREVDFHGVLHGCLTVRVGRL